ncbi:hypothetical protein BS50DRAFT_656165 [Corynespora cassiicola Philippines]|uniref:HNH nuclease domain-containing protein n=1 Tax=Corynespora cassiicola Philippines TaxID=1448308 RepID=A0A2T2N3J6_CORCC|nr:hypothetical protein BS50DRAFT_656165 [Corynespora cassiicola Philippines]
MRRRTGSYLSSICNDRGWFTSYVPYSSFVESYYHALAVTGFGTVVLPVKKSPNRSGPNAHGQIILKDVLHVPPAVCNIIAYKKMSARDGNKDYNFSLRASGNGSVHVMDSNKRSVAYFVPNPLPIIRLSGPPVGPRLAPCALRGRTELMLSIRWPGEEIMRWIAHLFENNLLVDNAVTNNVAAETTTNRQPESPYTYAEKEWLKQHYGDEFHFLRDCGLRIFREEDREVGRTLLRQLMAADNEGDSDSDKAIVDPIMPGMEKLLLSPRTYRWVQDNYGNFELFMRSYGLDPTDADEFEEAQMIARGLMKQDRSGYVGYYTLY